MRIEYYVKFGERSSHTGREVEWYKKSLKMRERILYPIRSHILSQ